MNYKRIRRTMRKYGWRSGELAELIGIEENTMRRKLYGFEEISVLEAIKIIAALDISAAEASLIIMGF